jgi:CDP-glucose 4,6-dehydratase
MNFKEIFEKTYKGKKVLLTGHTGFKGSWMLAWLTQLGAVVKGYALSPENENDLYIQLDGEKLCDSVIADIRDKEKLYKEIKAFQPDFIFHLAAQPLVRRSYEEPIYTFEVNVNGTANLLESVRDLEKPCCIVIITTDKVYENKETNYAYKETDKLGGYDPYSASKAAAEIVVSSYRNSFFDKDNFQKHQKAIATARAGNVIGGGDWSKDRIVPDIIRALQSGQAVLVRNPKAVRPWQHVLEPLSGYLLLGARLVENPAKFSDGWNLGPENNDVLTVKELVEQAIKAWGKGDYSTPEQNDSPHEAGMLKLDISKARKELCWKPKMNSSEAIRKTITWYKNATKNNSRELVIQQILQYQQS